MWALLLDPNVMGGCVPGMQSIEVVSDVEYISHIQVKIAFVSARFKIKTTIVEMRAPNYLRSEGTGEDASVASSLKQSSEIFLTGQPDGKTELRMKINVDVLGRLGTFGLSVMKTKADRMWEEFGTNLSARLVAPAEAEPAVASAAPAAAQTVAKAQAASPASPASAIEEFPLARPPSRLTPYKPAPSRHRLVVALVLARARRGQGPAHGYLHRSAPAQCDHYRALAGTARGRVRRLAAGLSEVSACGFGDGSVGG